jgi:hypothetical protein
MAENNGTGNQMKIDVIVCWPRNCDYPLWRQYVHENRNRFSQVIVIFTETESIFDMRDFLVNEMGKDRITMKRSPNVRNEDWRNIAVNYGLQHSDAEWVWFTEQDFLPQEGFWPEVEKGIESGAKVLAAFQGNRLHPCCILTERTTIEMTKKNFGIVVDKSDHFSVFQKNIENLRLPVFTLTQYQHLNGLTHNLKLLENAQEPNYQEREFINYLRRCLTCGIKINPLTENIYIKYLQSKGVITE